MTWDSSTTYPIGGLAKGSNGIVYESMLGQSGNNPVSDSGSNWKLWRNSLLARDFSLDARNYGLKEGNTPSQNGLAIRSAISDAAQVAINTSISTVDIVSAHVFIPSGVYEFDYIEYANGVQLTGASMASTALLHKGSGEAFSNPGTGFMFGVWIRDLALIGEKVSLRHGFSGYRLIRSCGLDRVLFDGFDRNINNNECWTFKVEDCQAQSALSNNIYWNGATNAMISGGRYDVAGEDSILITNDTINTENLLIIGVASQASQKSGIRLDDIKTAIVKNCFLEALAQSGDANSAYLHADMDGTGSLEIIGNYITRGSSGEDGKAGVFVDNVKNLVCMGNKTQSQAVGMEIGAGVESASVIECTFSNPTRMIDNSAGFIEIKEGFRPTIANGVDLNDSPDDFNGKVRSSFVAGVKDSGYLAMGAYNGVPAIQGGGTGTNYRIILNPFQGDVEAAFGTGGKFLVGATRKYLRNTSSNIDSSEFDNVVIIDTTSGGRTYTLRTADVENGRYIELKKKDPGSNSLIIATEGSETIDGSATVSFNDAYASVAVFSDGTNWFTVC